MTSDLVAGGACSSAAALLPMAGTAPLARTWYLVEDGGPWSARAVDDHGAPHVIALRETLGRDERILLVRRRGQRSTSPSDASVWRFSPGVPSVFVASAPSLARRGRSDAVHWSSTNEHPRVLVCTNGKRDTCCAVHGGALLRDFDQVQDVWESSHIGGHRFAPTILHVPTGYVAGRITVADLNNLTVADSPIMDLRKLRGRGDLSAPEQAADIAVRDVAAWTNPYMGTSLVSTSEGRDKSSRTYIVSNEARVSYRVTMIRHTTQRFQESCGADLVTDHYWAPADSPAAFN